MLIVAGARKFSCCLVLLLPFFPSSNGYKIGLPPLETMIFIVWAALKDIRPASSNQIVLQMFSQHLMFGPPRDGTQVGVNVHNKMPEMQGKFLNRGGRRNKQNHYYAIDYDFILSDFTNSQTSKGKLPGLLHHLHICSGFLSS